MSKGVGDRVVSSDVRLVHKHRLAVFFIPAAALVYAEDAFNAVGFEKIMPAWSVNDCFKNLAVVE